MDVALTDDGAQSRRDVASSYGNEQLNEIDDENNFVIPHEDDHSPMDDGDTALTFDDELASDNDSSWPPSGSVSLSDGSPTFANTAALAAGSGLALAGGTVAAFVSKQILASVLSSYAPLTAVIFDTPPHEWLSDTKTEPDYADMTPDGYIRMKFVQIDLPTELRSHQNENENAKLEPLKCAVNIKEKLDVTGHKPQLVQKKSTFYPDNKCFDTHVYPGRVIQIIVMRGDRAMAESTLRLQDFVKKCKADGVTNLWKLVGFGPLHYCEQEALCKLTVEISVLAYLTPLAKQADRFLLPKITQLLSDLDANTELQDVWLSIAGTGPGGYFLPADALRHELRRSYGQLVRTKYEDLVDKVFDRVIHLLTDRSTWEPEVITVFQFVYCFHEKQLVVFIESLAHETWIVDTINCRVRSKIQRVIERLKHVPVPPPPDVLRHIGLLILDEDIELRKLAESYLINAQGPLRSDLITAYLAFLEHDDSDTRRGACRALAVITARRCLGALAFVSHNDRKGSVREEARRAISSFGVEAGAVLKNGEQNYAEAANVRF